MKVLIDINHPAHVHFFKHFIAEYQKRGHEVIVTASAKDIALDLLAAYQIPYVYLGSYGTSILQKLIMIPVMAFRMWRVVKKHKADLLLGLGSSRITHAGYLTGTPAYVFTDTEHATEQIALFKPFARKIITPESFHKRFGEKHHTYAGYHELAYLHPNRFKADPTVLETYGIQPNDTYFVLRFVSWEASHDIGTKGLSTKAKQALIAYLSKKGKVIISAEGSLPPTHQQLQYSIPYEEMHQVLAHASGYIGEGGTMAIEAALLGIPSVLLNPLKAGVFEELAAKYGLLVQIPPNEKAVEEITKVMDEKEVLTKWKQKRSQLLTDKVDVTDWMISFVETSMKQDGSNR